MSTGLTSPLVWNPAMGGPPPPDYLPVAPGQAPTQQQEPKPVGARSAVEQPFVWEPGMGGPPPPDYKELDEVIPAQRPGDIPSLEEMGWLEWAGRGAVRTARDIGVTAAKSAVGLPQAVTGLVDMVPITAGLPGGGPGGPLALAAEKAGVPLYGWSGWMQEKLGIKYDEAQQVLHEAYSPETRQAYRKVSEAKGILGKLGAALKNPSVVLATVGESIPQMLAGGLIGKAIGAVPAIGKYGYAIGEGLMSAGSGAEQTRAQSPSGFLTEEQTAIHAASGMLTGAIGVLGGKVAARLGVDDIDVLLAGGASQEAQRNVLIRALAGALIEGGVEEAPQSVQEQIASNLANGKPWHEGWDESLVLGALSGAVMGGATQLRPRTQRLEELKRLRSKGFVSEDDAAKHGVRGKTRKERLAAVDEEIQQTEKEIQDASQVPEDQGVPEETGEVRQGGEADRGGDLRQGVEEPVGGGQTAEGQVDVTPPVPEGEVAPTVGAQDSLRGRRTSSEETAVSFDDLGSYLDLVTTDEEFGQVVANNMPDLDTPEVEAVKAAWKARSAGADVPWPWEGEAEATAAEPESVTAAPPQAEGQQPTPTTEPGATPGTPQEAPHAVGMQPDGQVRTLSGRTINPPRQKVTGTNAGVKRNIIAVDTWLVQEGVAEAESKGDEFNGDQFRRINPKKITPAERDGLNLYLFGQEDISLTKPVVQETTPAAPDTPVEPPAPGQAPGAAPAATTQPAALGEPTETPEVASATTKPQPESTDPLADHFTDRLTSGQGYSQITDARKEAEGILGQSVKPGSRLVKDVDEAVERGVVRAARKLVSDDPQATFDSLVDLYGRQPTLGARTSTSMIEQAYSTPAPLAYLASHLAGVTDTTSVYDSSAGNGMLLVGANLDKALANELNPRRAEALKNLGVRTENNDATKWRPDGTFDAVIINPPFGKVRDTEGNNTRWSIDGLKTTEVDHAIALNSLASMAPDGRAVIILGSKGFETGKPKDDVRRATAYMKQKRFYDTVYDNYNVVDHFTVGGDLYAKQGAKFPVDMIVIDGSGASSRAKPYNYKGGGLPQVYDTWEGLKDEKLTRVVEPRRPGAGGVRPPGGLGTGLGPVSQPGGETGARPSGHGGKPGTRPGDGVARPGGQHTGPVVEGGEVGGGTSVALGGVRGDTGGTTRPAPEQLPDEGEARPGPGGRGTTEQSGGVGPGGEVTQSDLDAAMRAAIEAEFGQKEAAPKEPTAAPKATGTKKPVTPKKTAPKEPSAPQKKPAERSEQTKKALDDALAEFKDVFGTTFDAGLDPKKVTATVKLTRAAIDHGVSKFQEFVEFVAGAIGKANALKISDYLESAWRALRQLPGYMHLSQEGKVRDILVVERTTSQEKETEFQVAYISESSAEGIGTLVPKQHAAAVRKTLSRVVEKYGSLDAFVAKELGYADLAPYFSAEQVDALALMIANHKEGRAFILGDQTGVGKGRVAAGMMVYAKRQGFAPVFVTADPSLFADMIRDLTDIGQNTADHPFQILPTNTLAKTGQKDTTVTLPDGRILKQTSATANNRLAEAVANFNEGKGLTAKGVTHDAIFTTYSQLQPVKQERQPRHYRLAEIAPNAFFIMDESHNAGGGRAQDQHDLPADEQRVTRAMIARELLRAAPGQVFLSATYAKRPEIMDLYARTGMIDAVQGGEDALQAAMVSGGIPLQQVVSEMLVESGSYLRRERSYDGVDFKPVVVDVGLENADAAAGTFRGINAFDKEAQSAKEALKADLVNHGVVVHDDPSTNDKGVTSIEFSSIMWNLTSQMLFALKAEKAAQAAVESWNAGNTPVVVVDNTMEAALKHYLEENPTEYGGSIDLTFRDLLRRYLERARQVTCTGDHPVDEGEFGGASVVHHSITTVKQGPHRGDTRYKYVVSLSDQQLGKEAVALYDSAVKTIDAFSVDMPVSPIDKMRQVMRDAGMRISEVTGRNYMIEYGPGGTMTLQQRPVHESGNAGKQRTIYGINDGTIDGVILNRSGATGVSIHASEKNKPAGQRPRHMIIAQAAMNIDEFMQMLGRVHRTGQVTLPSYELFMSNAPAETRPASVLVKKLSSLNANVTASASGSVSFDAPDILNAVGDRIVADYIADHPEINRELGDPVHIRQDGTAVVSGGEAKKVSGRMALMPVEEQQQFWDEVIGTFNEEIEELTRVHRNPLAATIVPMEAERLESFEIFEGDRESDSPFRQPANMEKVRSKRLSNPMLAKDIKAKVDKFYGGETTTEAKRKWHNEKLEQLRETAEQEFTRRSARLVNDDALASLRKNIDDSVEFIRDELQSVPPGSVVRVEHSGTEGTSQTTGIVLSLKPKSQKASVSRSGWIVEIALASPDRILRLPLNRMDTERTGTGQSITVFSEHRWAEDSDYQAFETPSEAFEERFLATGNILAGFSALADQGGSVIFYTDNEGASHRGVLLPRAFNAEQWQERRPVVFNDAGYVLRFLDQGGGVHSHDFAIQLSMDESGNLLLRSPRSRQESGKYTTDRKLLEAMGRDFVSRGNVLLATVPKGKVLAAVNRILEIGSLQTADQKELARSLAEKQAEPKSKRQQSADNAVQEVKDAADELRKALGGLGMNQPLDPKVVKAVAKLTVKIVKAGTLKFAAFLEQVAKVIGQAATDRIRPVLESEWEKLRKTGEFKGMEALVKEEPAPGETTGTKNVKTDELREKAGLGERVKGEAESIEQWQAEAESRIAANPQYAPRLAEEVAKTERSTDKVEDAVLQRHIRDLENRRQAGEDVLDEMITAVEASEVSGKQWGQWGRGRQVELAADFSMQGIVRQHLRSVNEHPTDEQMAEYEELADRVKQLEGELDTLRQQQLEQQVKAKIAEAVADSKKKSPDTAKKGSKRETLQRKASEAVTAFKDKWAALFQTGAVYDPKAEADKWVEITKAAGEVVKAYTELGVDSLLEFMARVKADFGQITAEQSKVFSDAWKAARGKAELPVEVTEWAEIGALARSLTRWAVESGIADREDVIDAVHEELTNVGIELERSEVMQAISGYGDFRELSQDEVDITIRRIKGETRQLLKIEDLENAIAQSQKWLDEGVSPEDVARRLRDQDLLPKASGRERATPEEIERGLIAEVNKLKNKLPVPVESGRGQLKSALSTAKTAAGNRLKDLDTEIKDLEESIAKRKPLAKPNERVSLTPDAELAAIREELVRRRKQRDALKKEYGKLFPVKKTGLSDAQRLKMAEAMLDRQLAEMEEDLKAGRLEPKAKRTPVTSAALEAKKLRRAELYEARDRAREASPEYQVKEAAKKRERYLKSQQKRLAFWEKRRDEARRGKLPEKRKPTPVDNEILEQQYQIELVKREARVAIEEAERAARGKLGKALGFGGDLLDLSRAIMTGFELSAVLRQGAGYTVGFPRQAFPAVWDSIRAAFSRRVDFALHDDLLKRPNHVDYMTGKMETTAIDGPLSSREELLRSRIASWLSQTEGWGYAVPRWATEGLLGSERAFRTFLNTMRADLFDYMKSSVEASRPGTWTADDAKTLGHASNVVSGRPTMRNAVGWSRVFFAPRWMWSRVLLTTGQPMWKGDRATRIAIGKVYVRGALGMAAFYIIKRVIYSLLAGDDDDEHKPKYELDPRSSDFGKTRLGETRLDSGTGVNQLVTLAARIATGETKRASGEIVPIRGDEVPYGGDNVADILSRFLRTKLAPLPSAIFDFMAGETVVGEKATVGKIVGDRTVPMTWRDIWEAEKELNVPQGTVAAIEAFFGTGMSTYGPRSEYRDASPEKRKEQFEKDLERMEWDSGAPAYSEYLTADQMKEVDERRERKKQGVFYEGLKPKPKRKDNDTDKSYQTRVDTWQKAQERRVEMTKTLDLDHAEAQQLLVEYHRRRDAEGKPRRSDKGTILTEQMSGKNRMDKSYLDAAEALAKLYGHSEPNKAWGEFYDSPEFQAWSNKWWEETEAMLGK